MKTFHDLKVFQSSIDLMVEVYLATESYPKREWYGLAAQMRRAACSVVSNIAEGQGRLTIGEWRQMLSHARGSLFELQAQVLIANRLRFANEATVKVIRARIADTARPLAGLIAYVRGESRGRTT